MSIKTYIRRALRYVIKGEPIQYTTTKVYQLRPSEQLKGKNIIVTGGGRGLGLSMAKRFVAQGANVLIAGRDIPTLNKSAVELNCKYLQLDVQNVVLFSDFFVEAEKLLNGPIDCLVNNAAISLHEDSFIEVTLLTVYSQLATNLKGPYFLSQKFVERYKFHNMKSGKILFISSETSITADDRPYGLTKAAINSLVQGLAFKYINDGIRVNAIAPGVTSSEMTGYDSNGNLYRKNHTTNRVFIPEEIAEIACFMLSDISNTLTGQVLVCNEGNTINARWK